MKYKVVDSCINLSLTSLKGVCVGFFASVCNRTVIMGFHNSKSCFPLFLCNFGWGNIASVLNSEVHMYLY